MGAWFRAAAVLSLIVPREMLAQTISGIVQERTTGALIPLATVIATGDSVPGIIAISTSTGRFSIVVPRPGLYRLEVRRIGYAPTIIERIRVAASRSTEVKAILTVLAVSLDTVSTVERQGSSLTPGRTFVQRHLGLKRGLIVSGFDILRSGLPLSEYLGKLDGLKLIHIGGTTPLVPAVNANFLTSGWETKCLYARVDWVPLAYLLMVRGRESIDDLLRLEEIKAVEVYRTIREAPEEWRFEATVSMIYSRTNGGATYLLGHTGRPIITGDLLSDDNKRFNTSLVLDESIRPVGLTGLQSVARVAAGGRVQSIAKQGFIAPICGFMQIWTDIGW